MHYLKILTSGFIIFVISFTVSAAQDEAAWNEVLKKQFYQDRAIKESNDVIELEAPYRAEDAALVPIKINSKINQKANKYIKRITLVIDKNPTPFAGEFNFTPKSGKADIAMRLRVNTYSYVRAIAEMNDGSLHMTKSLSKPAAAVRRRLERISMPR